MRPTLFRIFSQFAAFCLLLFSLYQGFARPCTVGAWCDADEYAMVALRMHDPHALKVVVLRRLPYFASDDVIDGCGHGLVDTDYYISLERFDIVLAGGFCLGIACHTLPWQGDGGSERDVTLEGIAGEGGFGTADGQSVVTRRPRDTGGRPDMEVGGDDACLGIDIGWYYGSRIE